MVASTGDTEGTRGQKTLREVRKEEGRKEGGVGGMERGSIPVGFSAG